MAVPARFVFAFVPLIAACSTQRSAVRETAARELACPEDAIRLAHDEGRLYRATGCGASVRVACYDPNDSTGASFGWTDPLTAGGRVRCEVIDDRRAPPVAKSAPSRSFDRALAAKLLEASAGRARSCGVPGGPAGRGTAHVAFANDGSVSSVELEAPFSGTEVGRCVERELLRVSLTPFDGEPVRVAKSFEIAP